MSVKVVLCTCSKCKNGTENIGSYVHPTTKWRHEKKQKETIILDLILKKKSICCISRLYCITIAVY